MGRDREIIQFSYGILSLLSRAPHNRNVTTMQFAIPPLSYTACDSIECDGPMHFFSFPKISPNFTKFKHTLTKKYQTLPFQSVPLFFFRLLQAFLLNVVSHPILIIHPPAPFLLHIPSNHLHLLLRF